MEQKELLTVIVADDETELREAVCSVIPWKEIGFRLVGSAGNGLDALQLVEQLQPDLLLTDIRMPYISGVSLAQQVRELRPLTQIGYDDFAYAQKAIEYNVISYLLKPISMRELTEALAEIRGKIRRKFARLLPQKPEKSGWRELLLPLLLDGFAEEAQQDDPALLASLVGAGILAAGQERYSLTVLAIRLEQDGKNRTTPDMAYTVDMLLGRLCRSRSVYSGGRLLTLLIAEEEPRGLELAIDELRQSFARVLELRAIVGISHPFTSFCRCHAASREAVDAQRFAGESGIYHISQIAAESGTAQTDLGALLAPLDNLLRSGSREELEKQLVQSFGASSGTAESDSVTLQVLALAQRVLHTAVSPGEAAALLRRCRIPEPLFSISPPQELQRRVTALCLAARDLLAERRRDGVSLLCAQAMETIEKQYMEEDLSLGGVSEQLHVSPNYLSANMKKYAGDTFMNLLIKKRMEVAHALLTTTGLKIYEVARQCGYSDQHYFSFCFKKYYGVSPAQLRRAESERGGGGT